MSEPTKDRPEWVPEWDVGGGFNDDGSWVTEAGGVYQEPDFVSRGSSEWQNDRSDDLQERMTGAMMGRKHDRSKEIAIAVRVCREYAAEQVAAAIEVEAGQWEVMLNDAQAEVVRLTSELEAIRDVALGSGTRQGLALAEQEKPT